MSTVLTLWLPERVSVSLRTNPFAFSLGIRPGLDGVPYVIDTATHRYTAKSTFTTDISATLYDGKSSSEDGGDGEGGGGDGGSSSGSGTNGGGKVAPNSAPGIPATPAHFLTPRRGRTDEN
ncbi:hypothetical protein RMR21_022175 [Agrobacterium sp. rho-8.1]|nr:hypothetical protein [Agrobacterium sp. rho-8.1]